MLKKLKETNGASLYVAMVGVLIITILGTSLLFSSSVTTRISVKTKNAEQAYQTVNSAVQLLKEQLSGDTIKIYGIVTVEESNQNGHKTSKVVYKSLTTSRYSYNDEGTDNSLSSLVLKWYKNNVTSPYYIDGTSVKVDSFKMKFKNFNKMEEVNVDVYLKDLSLYFVCSCEFNDHDVYYMTLSYYFVQPTVADLTGSGKGNSPGKGLIGALLEKWLEKHGWGSSSSSSKAQYHSFEFDEDLLFITKGFDLGD